MAHSRLLLIFLLLMGTPVQAVNLPELPKVYIDTTMPTTAVTITVCARGCNYTNNQLQLAIDQARLGTTILLEPGAIYTPPSERGFILRNKTTGSGWIVIKTNRPLPAEGVRVKPSDATNMAKVERYVVDSPIMKMTAAGDYDIPNNSTNMVMAVSPLGSYEEFLQRRR